MKVKGEGKKCKLAECAMRGGVSVRTCPNARGNGRDVSVRNSEDCFPQKRAGFFAKQVVLREKVHRFSLPTPRFRKIRIFSFANVRLFETKCLPLHLTKHNFPFFPAAWRRLYSAVLRANGRRTNANDL